MILEQLDNELKGSLRGAKEVYVAVALLKPYGFEAIEESLIDVADTCVRKYLIGINLPTSPSVLRKALILQEELVGRFFAKVYRARRTFHPKVYLIRKPDNSLVGFVGSANATQGGLLNNVELTVTIEDPQCNDLLIWFNAQFEAGSLYDEAFVVQYEELLKRNERHNAAMKSNLDSLQNDQNGAADGARLVVNNGQFFRQSDFDAFSETYQLDRSDNATALRREVRNRFWQLGDKIYPRFLEYGITDLHEPLHQNNRTSYHWHTGRDQNVRKDAIWLHFGKHPDELAEYTHKSFPSYARVLTILLNRGGEKCIGNWLVLGRGYDNHIDRQNLRGRLEASEEFSKILFDYVSQLGGSFILEMHRQDTPISVYQNHEDLREALLQDNYHDYLIFKRERHPNDSDLSFDKIEETVLNDYAALYRIYDLVRHRPPVQIV